MSIYNLTTGTTTEAAATASELAAMSFFKIFDHLRGGKLSVVRKRGTLVELSSDFLVFLRSYDSTFSLSFLGEEKYIYVIVLCRFGVQLEAPKILAESWIHGRMITANALFSIEKTAFVFTNYASQNIERPA